MKGAEWLIPTYWLRQNCFRAVGVSSSSKTLNVHSAFPQVLGTLEPMMCSRKGEAQVPADLSLNSSSTPGTTYFSEVPSPHLQNGRRLSLRLLGRLTKIII